MLTVHHVIEKCQKINQNSSLEPSPIIWSELQDSTPRLAITLHTHSQQTFLPSDKIIRKMHDNDINGKSTLASVELHVKMRTTADPRAGFSFIKYE